MINMIIKRAPYNEKSNVIKVPLFYSINFYVNSTCKAANKAFRDAFLSIFKFLK